jgi:glucose-fructose oxidoreductase
MKRRQFIQKSVVGATALAATPAGFVNCLSPQTPKRQDSVAIALVGLGYYSTDVLAPAFEFTKHCHLAGIVTGSKDKAEKWQKQHQLADGNIYNYENFDAIAQNKDIDVVYIVLPPFMHAEYTRRAAQAGKHVWCEKPMAMTAQECQSMIDVCRQNKVNLCIGYRMHHEPNTQRIMQLAKTKPFGAIKSLTAKAGYFDSRTTHWKQKKAMGGGAMYDMGVYPLNAVRYATGLEPIAVNKAQASTTRPDVYTEVDETMYFELEFPGGIIASCETSFGKGMNSLNITCEKGWYNLEPFQAYSGIAGKMSDGTLLNASIPNQQAKQMDDDALAIINKTPVLVSGEEGLRDIRIVEAIYESARLKKRVVL